MVNLQWLEGLPFRYFSEFGIWVGKILTSDVRFAKLAKLLSRQNFALYHSSYIFLQVIINQCKQRNTELQRSVLFDIVDGEELYISSIKTSVNGNEWKLCKSGKLNVS